METIQDISAVIIIINFIAFIAVCIYLKLFIDRNKDTIDKVIDTVNKLIDLFSKVDNRMITVLDKLHAFKGEVDKIHLMTSDNGVSLYDNKKAIIEKTDVIVKLNNNLINIQDKITKLNTTVSELNAYYNANTKTLNKAKNRYKKPVQVNPTVNKK